MLVRDNGTDVSACWEVLDQLWRKRDAERRVQLGATESNRWKCASMDQHDGSGGGGGAPIAVRLVFAVSLHSSDYVVVMTVMCDARTYQDCPFCAYFCANCSCGVELHAFVLLGDLHPPLGVDHLIAVGSCGQA